MNARGKFSYTLLLAGTLFTTTPVYAAQSTETIDARISRLEQELAELKSLVKTNPPAPTPIEIPLQQPPRKNIEPINAVKVSPDSGVKVQL